MKQKIVTMSKVLDFIKSPHIIIALATGISIVVLAYISKLVLPQPIGYLPSAIPPFITVIFESLQQKFKNHKLLNIWYWVAAILLTTIIIIIIHH